MLLADLGASVLRIERTRPVELGRKRKLELNLLNRSRQDVALDLKDHTAVDVALELVSHADILIEGFRPGVMERLRLGPDACLARNPALVYGRMTGWGQEGPLAQAAGHDLNYIALTGALDAIGRPGQAPAVPLNLVGDMGGGALYLAVGVLAALREAQRSGRGQVVDAAIVDGVLSLMTMQFGSLAEAAWSPPRGHSTQDEGPYWYDVYQCADGKWISVAAAETRFFDELLRRLEIPESAIASVRRDRAEWPRLRSTLAERFRSRTRDEWTALLEGTDACFAPVLSIEEVEQHRHISARGSIVRVDGVPQPAPAPRFSRTPLPPPRLPHRVTKDEALATVKAWIGADRYAELKKAGTLDAVYGTPESA
ncbi:CaiB/BaiF CoA transferase family protein [Bradyrhizobium genosp. P]|uniref:CaiB/BaiF CoA transferase family protein n=1 Tax=Bradyrhizobium genosp. P TaxID=83641 RepID=UPI003CF318B3